MVWGPPPSFSHQYHYSLPFLRSSPLDLRERRPRGRRPLLPHLHIAQFALLAAAFPHFSLSIHPVPILSVSANGAWIGKGFGTACNLPSSFHACPPGPGDKPAASGTSTVTSRPRGELNGECLG